MIRQLFSGDFPRSRVLAILLVIIAIGLLLAPVLFAGSNKSLHVAAKICIFVVVVASFDLLLGYTGLFSFAHTMFFGIGAYGIAIACVRLGPSWSSVVIGLACALALSVVVALLVGLVSLRLRHNYYAMITLAVAVSFQALASQFSSITGGDDGLSVKVPAALTPAFVFAQEPFLGMRLDGRVIAYYLVLASCALLFLALLRIVNSPFGRVLLAVRDNELRAEAIGYRPVVYRALSSVWSAVFATLAGALMVLWIRYTGPDTTLSLEIMLNLLLMLVIGGMATMYGAAVGAVIFITAQSYLQDLLAVASGLMVRLPVVGPPLAQLFTPARWLLWLGVLFVISVYFFPRGVVGELRKQSGT